MIKCIVQRGRRDEFQQEQEKQGRKAADGGRERERAREAEAGTGRDEDTSKGHSRDTNMGIRGVDSEGKGI